jgi:hypothetical protein
VKMSCERHSAIKPPSASCVTLKTISMQLNLPFLDGYDKQAKGSEALSV